MLQQANAEFNPSSGAQASMMIADYSDGQRNVAGNAVNQGVHVWVIHYTGLCPSGTGSGCSYPDWYLVYNGDTGQRITAFSYHENTP
jgi:hypothetical protein